MSIPPDPQSRERDVPDEQKSPVPKPIAVIAVALLAWGAWYYFQNTGYPASAGDRRSRVTVMLEQAVDGGTVYAGNCAACHQATGQGLAGVFPPLVGSDWVLENDRRLIQILLHGINGEIVVNGMTYNGVMPAFSHLSDAELAAVLTHIRSAWDNDATPIEAGQVAESRGLFPDRGPWLGGAELDDTFPGDDAG